MKKLATKKEKKLLNFNFKSTKWGAYDLETSCVKECCWKKGKVAKIVCWSFKDNNEESHRGHGKKEWLKIIEELTKQRRKIYLWGHNALKFDLRFFWEDFVWDKKNFTYYKDWGVKYKNITFFDTHKIYASKLENLTFDPEKRAKKIAGKNLFEDPRYHDDKKSTDFLDELLTYCDNDVDIVWNLVKTLPTYKKGTGASLGIYLIQKNWLSWKDWRKDFPNFALPEFDDKREFVEKCYTGALNFLHNEQKNPDIQPVVADLVSGYPAIMKERPLPVGKGQWMDAQHNNLGIEKGKIYDGSDGFLGFYRIHVKCLQLKKEWADIPKIIYTRNELGVRQGRCKVVNTDLYFVGSELKFLLKYYEGEFKIVRGLIFRTKTGVLADYVDHFFSQKEEASLEIDRLKKQGEKIDESIWAKYLFAKYMLNAVYGKFGQKVFWKVEALRYIGKIPEHSKDKRHLFFWHKQQCRWYYFAELEKVRTKGHNYVPYSAAVTAYGRINLLTPAIKYREILLEAETDRITLRSRPEDFATGRGLGEWKEENKYRGKGWFSISSKYCRWGYDHIIAKQIPKEFQNLLNFDGKKQILEIPYWKREANTVREIIRQVTLRGADDNPKFSLVNGMWKCRGSCEGYHEDYKSTKTET